MDKATAPPTSLTTSRIECPAVLTCAVGQYRRVVEPHTHNTQETI